QLTRLPKANKCRFYSAPSSQQVGVSASPIAHSHGIPMLPVKPQSTASSSVSTVHTNLAPSSGVTRMSAVPPWLCLWSARLMLTSSTALMSLRSEEHTSELQSSFDLGCRLLLDANLL